MSFNKSNLTPAMRQYADIKEQYPNAVVLFRMGDFYETFYEDAKTVSKVLDIVLTSRGSGLKKAPLAGIPYHALDQYLAKLIRANYTVVMVEQLEDPKLAKGIVKRGVVRIVTPGTIIEDTMLEKASNNYLLCIDFEQKKFGISSCDISTGEFVTTTVDTIQQVFAEVEKYSPAEIIIPLSLENAMFIEELKKKSYLINTHDDRFYVIEKAQRTIQDHFKLQSVDAFGLTHPLNVSSSGALLSYLKETQMNTLSHLSSIRPYTISDSMILDAATQRNLELVKNIKDQTTRGTLFETINFTTTAMGQRKLKQWLLRPSLKLKTIEERLESVSELTHDQITLDEIKSTLDEVQDIQRIITRITYGNANPKDLVGLKQSLLVVPKLKKLLASFKSKKIVTIKEINEATNVTKLIEESIKQEPPITIREGNIIKDGYNKELDELREIAYSTKDWLQKFEQQEQKSTNIKSLKVKYNRVFGYFIEVTKSNLHLVPSHYTRKQTQANSERYITDELKQKESLILGAEDKIQNLEYDLYQSILKEISLHTKTVQNIANIISELDCLVSFAECALQKRYFKPDVTNDYNIMINDGRHPVVESIERGEFIENDVSLDQGSNLHIITGPNMAGKSTYLRQVALIVLLAQIGSFVPARSASIGLVDRIFSRVGAYDDLSMGQSTFMIEMTETANILHNATNKSLIILDEIGRGTSTYDGFSLAWAISEYVVDILKSKTLFATHYHQLNKLTDKYPTVKNFHVAIQEDQKEIIFLRKIQEGGTDKSYGVHVAKLAGLPQSVIERAKFMMDIFEHDKIIDQIHSQVIADFTNKTESKIEPIKTPHEKKAELDPTISKKLNKKPIQKSLFEVVDNA